MCGIASQNQSYRFGFFRFHHKDTFLLIIIHASASVEQLLSENFVSHELMLQARQVFTFAASTMERIISN